MLTIIPNTQVPVVSKSTNSSQGTLLVGPPGNLAGTVGIHSDKASMSSLSRQLGESAVRAETRAKTLSRSELGAEAKRVLVTLVDNYEANQAIHNREVPKTDDPGLLNRARHATQFLTQSLSGNQGGKSPFSGFSREQLVLIAYDEKGPYTVNERRVAWGDVQKIESDWRFKAIAQGSLETSVTDPRARFLTEALAHYRGLPAIEQAQYDEGYEARLQHNIKQDGGPPRQDDHLPNLFEILAGYQRPSRKAQTPVPKAPTATPDTLEKTKENLPVATQTPALKTSSLSPDACPTPAAVARS